MKGTIVGKSERGPDLLDCAMYVGEMQRQQNCCTTMLVEFVGSDVVSQLRVSIVTVSRELTTEGPVWSVATSFVWPGRRHRTFEGALFSAIAQHDAEIGRHAFQQILNLA